MSKFNTRFSHLRINTGEDLSIAQKQKSNLLLNENTFRLHSPKVMGNFALTNRPVQVLYTSPITSKNDNSKYIMNNYLSAGVQNQVKGQGQNRVKGNNNNQSGYLYTVSGKNEKFDCNNINNLGKNNSNNNNNLLNLIKNNLRGKNNEGNMHQNINTHYSSNAPNKNPNTFKSSSVRKDSKYFTIINSNNISNKIEKKGIINNNNIINNNKLNENFNKFTNKNNLEKSEANNYVANLKKNLAKENISGYLHSEGNVTNYNQNNNNTKLIRTNSTNKNLNTENNITNYNNNYNINNENKAYNNNNQKININEIPRTLKKDITFNNNILLTPVNNNQMLMNHNLSAKRDNFVNKTERNINNSLTPNIRLDAPFISDQKKKLIVKNNSKYFSSSLNKNKINAENKNESINYDERVVHTDLGPPSRKSDKPEMIDIMKLISSNQPPISLNVLNKKFENFENSKYSTKSLKYIKGYSANTHQGTVR
jgi:hypothetical protein